VATELIPPTAQRTSLPNRCAALYSAPCRVIDLDEERRRRQERDDAEIAEIASARGVAVASVLSLTLWLPILIACWWWL